MNQEFRPKKIYVLKEAQNLPLTRYTLKKLAPVPVEITDTLPRSRELVSAGDPVSAGKDILFITVQRGPFLTKCPGTKSVLCCNYYVLELAANCNFDCSYCFLQHYSRAPYLTLYANTDGILPEIEDQISRRRNPLIPLRVGTGEFTDSLSLDSITDFSRVLVPPLAGRKDVILELKTKSSVIKNLLSMPGAPNIVVAWSLNPPGIISSEEKKTASLEERIEAAVSCTDAGYSTAFHFDPVIHFSGWEKEYKKTVDTIFKNINPASVSWISLGALRFTPALKTPIERRTPESRILGGEFLPGKDGKMRYPKKVREIIFKEVNSWIRAYTETVPVYLCMETKEVWKKSLSTTPCRDTRLEGIF
ncbi:MAG: radical SAM protein [Nitrospinota bacterium]